MPSLVACVIGNGFVKTFAGDRPIIFPSVIATEQAGIDFSGFKSSADFVIEFDKKRLAIGDTAWKLGRMRMTQMDRSRVGSEFYCQLFAAALVSTIKESGPVNVVLTLPIGWYAKRDEVRDKMKGEYTIKRDKKTFTYEISARNIRIIPEGFGVLAAQMLDDQGCITRREIGSATVGIVEIGTGTTDLSLFQSLELVPVKSRGVDIGLKDVWEAIQADINEDHGRELELHKIDEAIWTGAFKDSGEIVNVKPYVKKHMPSLANAIAAEINNRWDGGRIADGIYFAGGGAPQCYPYLSYRHGKLVDQSHIADALGAYLYGLFRSKQGK